MTEQEILDLQNANAELKKKNDELTEKVDELTAKVDEQAATIDQLNSIVATAKTDAPKKEAKLELPVIKHKGKTYKAAAATAGVPGIGMVVIQDADADTIDAILAFEGQGILVEQA